jgi:hypothetical protein
VAATPRHRRFGPDRQTDRAGRCADIRFAEAKFLERAFDRVCGAGILAGPIIANIVEVVTVHDVRNAARCRERHYRPP